MSTPTAIVLKPRFLAAAPSFRLFPLPVFHRDLTSFNPSIAMHDGVIYFCLRHANLLSTANERYGFGFVLKDGARDLVNETSFGTLRVPEGPGALECELFPTRIREFEDVRIFRHGGRWLGLGCVVERKVGSGFPEILSVQMRLLFLRDDFTLESASPLPSPLHAPREKNWVPLEKEGPLLLMYRPIPLDVLSIDLTTGGMQHVATSPSGAQAWSGGSQFVRYAEGGWLGIIHRRAVLAGEYIYEHAFLRLREDFSSEVSAPFQLITIGIEFCAGLVIRENDLVLSFGTGDSRAFLATISKKDFATLFSG